MSRSLAGPLLLVGAGKMGGALLAGWLREGLDPKSVFIRDPSPSREVAELIARHEIATGAAIEPDAPPSVILLAVKPQIIDECPAGSRAADGKGHGVVVDRGGTDIGQSCESVAEASCHRAGDAEHAGRGRPRHDGHLRQ